MFRHLDLNVTWRRIWFTKGHRRRLTVNLHCYAVLIGGRLFSETIRSNNWPMIEISHRNLSMQVDVNLPIWAKSRKPKPEVELRSRGRRLEKGHDVLTLSQMVRFRQNSAGRCRMICMTKLLDVHFEDAQNGLVHAPKTANINENLDSLQHLIRTTAAKSQNLNSKYHKRLYYFAAQWHFGNVLQSNIIFCDICCFTSAILLPSSL